MKITVSKDNHWIETDNLRFLDYKIRFHQDRFAVNGYLAITNKGTYVIEFIHGSGFYQDMILFLKKHYFFQNDKHQNIYVLADEETINEYLEHEKLEL